MPWGGKHILGVELIAHPNDIQVSYTEMHLQSYGDKLETPKVIKANRENTRKLCQRKNRGVPLETYHSATIYL